MYPVFFSVSSNDESYAREIWNELPSDWAYLYSTVGQEGMDMWDEISRRELPLSKYFVVFWSQSYVTANGCIRELEQAAELSNNGMLSSLIIRIDDYPIIWDDSISENYKPVFENLSKLLAIRTSRESIPIADANHLVQRVIEPIIQSSHPNFNRDEVLEAMRSSSQKERFKCFPALWLSGFPGSGRRTLVEQFNRSMTPNGRPITVEVNAAALPKQVSLKLESQGLGADLQRLENLQETIPDDDYSAVVDRIEAIFRAGNYVVFYHSQILQNNIDLPEWVNDVINQLSPESRPKLFVVSQIPLSIERRTACIERLAEHRITGFLDHEVVTFTESLIAFFDSNPERWSPQLVESLIQAAQGNFGLLITLAQTSASIIDIGEIETLLERTEFHAHQSIAFYVDWAFAALEDDLDCQRALLFLNDVSPCDPRDLQEIFRDSEKSVLSILSKCMRFGFVERDDAGLYQLAPFLAGRLARHLVRSDLVDWRRTIIEKFASSPIDLDAVDNDFIRIESRIQASLWSGKEEVPSLVEKFLSASHWFQAGVRLYHARQHPAAYRLLKKAFAKREAFSDASRTELLRYFGLSAIRNGKDDDVQICLSLLKGDRRTQEIAAYLEAFNLETKRNYFDAKNKYEEALRLNQGKTTRLERIYRPLIRCILLTRYPDFRLAERYALDWSNVRETVFTKYSLARIYLLWIHKGPMQRDQVPDDVRQKYDDAIDTLKTHPGGLGAFNEILAEEAELNGDMKSAVEYLNNAINIDDRFELRLRRWQLMSRQKDMAAAVLDELEELKTDLRHASSVDIHRHGLVEIFVSAMVASTYSAQRLNKFASGIPSRDIGKIVARVKRETG